MQHVHNMYTTAIYMTVMLTKLLGTMGMLAL